MKIVIPSRRNTGYDGGDRGDAMVADFRLKLKSNRIETHGAPGGPGNYTFSSSLAIKKPQRYNMHKIKDVV